METAVKAQNQMIRELEEEIAVKEAQVKQYQKQVEAYKQQLVCSCEEDSGPISSLTAHLYMHI